eukprot:gnl/TRDRNA2_/TRDRNA2_167625_c0_seq1.p1 gnl/TRDRNA2_/TRDRNA2_167625_c0~~gnl/TRDRNA2_/TRDRNA2_167625_c0_seq1.p1  ORF type:complete len:273 (+),score=45.74 gnl/TRDRNA2_/TRDRNA2_167625_c0_seq1:69-821(+)
MSDDESEELTELVPCKAKDGDHAEQFDDDRFFKIESQDLIDTMGISALAIHTRGEELGLTKIVLVAIQAFTLQFIILIQLAQSLSPRAPDPDTGKVIEPPLAILWVAVYLHVVSSIECMPFTFTILFNFKYFHEDPLELFITSLIFLTDGLITPISTLIIGGFFLCTSDNVPDIILNSCGVAFISGIDNGLLALNAKMNELAGMGRDSMIVLPYNKQANVWCNWLITLVPIIPVVLTSIIVYVGTFVLKL